TGRRDGDSGLLVGWDGPPLRSGTRYHWRVQVWDETGAAAGVGQSWFETGLLQRDEWTAAWVARDPLRQPPVDPPGPDGHGAVWPGGSPLYLRREFTLTQPPVRARLYATAHGVYESRVNGTRIGRD